MLDPLSAAMLPVAPMGLFEVVAAPADALDPSIPAANRVAAPVPSMRAQPLLGVWRSVGVSMLLLPLSCVGVVVRETWFSYSVRKASIGASEAARLAG
jgi:hypothetical protein